MTRLSVNVNKIATIRNARGGNNPDLVQVVRDCERFGAEGITIHPRPDERHITTKDVYEISEVVTTEFNIEGYPDERFLKIIDEVKPAQATLVPDGPDVITSCAGWDVATHDQFLTDVVARIKASGVRVSLFMDPDKEQIEKVPLIGADRIELYTEQYATQYLKNKEQAIAPYFQAAEFAIQLGLGLNAGHDLDLDNLAYFNNNIPNLDEVSIGHALICDALYFGLENTIQLYLRQLKN
ncbi:pyridoxine 5'-phosphate synthase [Reichenbachiella sp. MALMAid0571]|uniref:pyridoxine 5'-phosphate synthase n=1 Tax=Reichenbachiella sp. MALMAid0571 TaxID=3143939 RepID=UPI0032DE42B9